jgi:Flp pilus assembly protein TadG
MQIPSSSSVKGCGKSRRARQGGQAVLETGLMLPWLIFSFIGSFDLGTACYSLISTQNAARAGAVWGSYSAANAGSSNFATQACSYALSELENAPGVGTGTSTCGGTSPVSVTASSVTGNDGQAAVSVNVTYKVKLLAVPSVLTNSLVVSRTVVLTIHG